MPDRRVSPEVEALVQGYVDGSLAPAECLRLLELLREQPELHRVVLEELRLDALLQEAVRRDAAAEPAAPAETIPFLTAASEPSAAGTATVEPYPDVDYMPPKPARRTPWRGWAMAAGVVLVLGASLWFAAVRQPRGAGPPETVAQPGTARVTALSGTVAVERNGRRFKPREGLLLQAGDAVITGAGSLAKLEYSGEQSWVEMASETELAMAQSGEGKRLELRRGRLEAQVAPQPAGQPMICLTPQGRATVLGTRFFLTALEQHGRLEVLRGMVQLATAGSVPADVNEGEMAFVAAGPPPTLERIGGRGVFEAESLDIVSSYGGRIISESDPNASGNYHRVLHAPRAGGSISYGIPIDSAGRYVFHLRFNQRSNRGIYQLFVNGEPRAEPFDFSRRGNVHRFLELEFCTFEVTEPGMQVFTFENRGRAAHGNSHKLSIDYFKLVRVPDDTPATSAAQALGDGGVATLSLDFNALAIAASTHAGTTVLPHASASGGELLRYNADAPGDKVTFRVHVPAAGSYRVAVKLLRHPSGGILQFAADDGNLSFNNVGGRIDNYGEAEAVELFELGTVTFAGAGPKQFRFEVRGRNPASSGFGIALDRLTLQRMP